MRGRRANRFPWSLGAKATAVVPQAGQREKGRGRGGPGEKPGNKKVRGMGLLELNEKGNEGQNARFQEASIKE